MRLRSTPWATIKLLIRFRRRWSRIEHHLAGRQPACDLCLWWWTTHSDSPPLKMAYNGISRPILPGATGAHIPRLRIPVPENWLLHAEDYRV